MGQLFRSNTGEFTTLKKGDQIVLEVTRQLLSFYSIDGSPILWGRNGSEKKFAPFLKSREDFIVFAWILGDINGFSVVVVKKNDSEDCISLMFT